MDLLYLSSDACPKVLFAFFVCCQTTRSNRLAKQLQIESVYETHKRIHAEHDILQQQQQLQRNTYEFGEHKASFCCVGQTMKIEGNDDEI